MKCQKDILCIFAKFFNLDLKIIFPIETPIKKSSPKPGCGNFNFTKLGKTLIYWFVILSTLNKPGLVSMYTAKPIGPIFALDLMIDPRNV